jgi:uncharacterized protein YjiK
MGYVLLVPELFFKRSIEKRLDIPPARPYGARMSAIGGPPPDSLRSFDPALPNAELAELPLGPHAVRLRQVSPRPVPEASGVAYHAGRGTLFVVGDEGHLVELGLDGRVRRTERLGELDLEGVAVGPGGRVYCVNEASPPKLLEIDPETFEVLREIKIDPDWHGRRVICRHENDGLEGLCWVPEDEAFYCLNQDRPPRIVRIELPRREGEAKIRGVIDLDRAVPWGSDLAWDSRSGHFLIAQAGKRHVPGALHEVSREGRLLRSLSIPGRGQEGFALGPDGSVFIAEEDGPLLRLDP